MHIFIKPQPIACLSFDLDDTLYDNRPLIRRAEQQLATFLQQQFAPPAQWLNQALPKIKQALRRQNPTLAHDLTLLRQQTIEQGLLQLGYAPAKAHKGACEAIECFLHYRSDFTLSTPVMALLETLAEKYRLIAITNGNADTARIGLDPYIAFALSSGNGLRMKPHADMFELALQRLKLPAIKLMHVGDSSASDVCGARQAGCQAVWLNPGFGYEAKNHELSDLVDNNGLMSKNPLLPQLRIADLQELRALSQFTP